jgi:hypothetical protein
VTPSGIPDSKAHKRNQRHEQDRDEAMKIGHYHRIVAAGFCAAVAMTIASPAAAQGACSREDLAKTAGNWVEALEAGNPFPMAMGEWVDYWENYQMGTLTAFFTKPRKVDHSLILLDTGTCRVFVEAVMTDPEHPYVMATQITHFGFNGSVGKIDNIVTDEGDWLFDANATLRYASRENWDVIPEGQRNTRAELIAAADAYLNLFKDKATVVPWGTPCNRLEGGVYTGKGAPDDSCNVGVPDNIDLIDRVYVVDETIGAVDVFLKFGANKRPDSHLFRVEDGKIRYIHTVTYCGAQDNCGFTPFKEMLKNNPAMQPDLGD